MHCTAVIPVYNEQASLRQLHDELLQIAREQSLQLDICFVDDGSTDDSWTVIEQLASDSPRTYGIRFRRNFGKAAALSAGFAEAKGSVVFTLDADLQDNPKEIPRFLAMLDEGYDVVSGWKVVRHDPWHKTLLSRVFNGLVGWMTGLKLHDHNCGFKCYRREVLSEVDLYGELHRFIPVLANARGFRVGEIGVEHRARTHGQSKYCFERFIKGFLDLLTVYFLTGYRQRPQHLLGTLGLVFFGLGAMGLTYLGGYWIIKEFSSLGADWLPLHQRPLTLYSLGSLLLGAQFISLGFLAELITANQGRQASPFSIRQQIAPTATSQPETQSADDQSGAEPKNDDSSADDESTQSSGEVPLSKWEAAESTTRELDDPSGLHGGNQDA